MSLGDAYISIEQRSRFYFYTVDDSRLHHLLRFILSRSHEQNFRIVTIGTIDVRVEKGERAFLN